MALFRDPDNRWATQVGRFVLAFGEIEHTCISCLEKIPQPGLGKTAATLLLSQRLLLLEDVLQSRPEAACERLLALVRDIKGVTSKRNLLVHNMLKFCFYMHDGKVTGVLEMSSSRNPKQRITYDEICALSDRLETLAFTFSAASAQAFEALPWIAYVP